MDLLAVLAALQLVGSQTPAFIALFEEVQKAFSTEDQAVLQEAIASLDQQADAQHQIAQGATSS
jgi:hypothetical protein